MTVFKRQKKDVSHTQPVLNEQESVGYLTEIAFYQGVCLGAHMPTDMCTALYLGQVVTQRFNQLGRSHQDRFKKE